jgi:thiol-disulfide isomerase/thioredoxin
MVSSSKASATRSPFSKASATRSRSASSSDEDTLLKKILFGIFGSIIIIVTVWLVVSFLRKIEKFESIATITYYYLPTCGWCTKFTPTWDKFAEEAKAKGLNVRVNKVNGNEASEEVNKYNINGFPHVQLVKGDKVVPFNGERTVESLMTFVKANA